MRGRLLVFSMLWFLGCDNAPEPITAYQLLTTPSKWSSQSFVFEEQRTNDFHWDCVFNEEVPEFEYVEGDIGRLEVEMDLYFRPDSTYLRVQRLNRYIRCKTCNEFTFAETVVDSLGAIFVADEKRLFFGSRNDLFQYYYEMEYKSRSEVIISEFFEVFAVLRNADCEFNGTELKFNERYPVDLVFRAQN